MRAARAAAVAIGAQLVMAASFATLFIAPHAHADPGDPGPVLITCGQLSCIWFVPHDGTAEFLPQCREEDGNANGLPCLWVDPDTGEGWYVGSENYR